MDRQYLLPESGNFYKANLHGHSTFSDGNLTPEELKALYKEHGYSVIAYTDHRTYRWHQELCDDEFLALGGYELDFNRMEEGQVYACIHLCAVAKDPKICTPVPGNGPYDLRVANEAIRQLNAGGFLVSLNHPVWSNMTMEDIFALKGFHSLEVFNSCCALAIGDSGDAALYNGYLRRNGHALPIATDDNHSKYNGVRNTLDCCKGYTVFKAPTLTYPAIIEAYESGNFYCSTGPEIRSLYIENDRICIDCSPAQGVFLHTKYISLHERLLMRESMVTHAEFDLAPLREKTPYVWLEVLDNTGGHAFAAPYFFI